MKIIWNGLFNYIFPSDILEKADYRLMLLKMEKGFPQINFIKLQQQQYFI